MGYVNTMVNTKTNNMAQQTAVEWLIDWIGKSQYFIGNDLLQAVQQAKAIEKEQIKAAYNKGYTEVEHDCCPSIGPDVSLFSNAEDYYIETYKQTD